MSLPFRSREWIGVALALAAAAAFALGNAAVGLAYQSGSNPLTVAAVRFVLPTVALVIWLRRSGVPLRLPARDGAIAVALGVLSSITSWSLLTAMGAIPVALAILVFYLFPLVAAAILAACGWETLGWRRMAAIVLAFAGLALALDPHGGSFDARGVALAFVAALALGTVITVSSRVFRAGESRPVTLYMAAVAGALLMILCAVDGDVALPRTGLGWAGFVGGAAFYAFAMISFFVAIALVGPGRVSLLSYAEPAITAGLGVVVLGEALAPVQVAGIVLVVTALVGVTWWRPRAR
jgi:drug/metabolite transporter (DMT)-like permease